MTADEDVIKNLEKFERNWHIFKACLYIVGVALLSVLIFYETNKTVNTVNAKNQRVEQLLRCSVPAFTPQNYSKADTIINKCLEIN